MRTQMLAVTLALTLATALPAQRVDDQRVAFGRTTIGYQAPPPSSAAPQPQPATRHSTRKLVMAGLIGGAIGAFGGAVGGMAIENCGSRPNDDMCGIVGGALGFLIGESIGVPVGINWVTGNPGKLGRTIPLSLGIAVGSVAIPGAVGLMIPAQLWGVIRTERKSS